tara:strand:+ start:705 stop:938 length:234 start_codon:yes stop_codon:yes gene_type:complete
LFLASIIQNTSNTPDEEEKIKLFDHLIQKKNDFKMPEMPRVSMKYIIPEENPIKFSNIKNFFDRKKIKADEEEKEKD